MNLLLFHPPELARPLPRTDPRAQHLLKVLKRGPGDTFDAGLVNGPRGRGTLVAVDDDALGLTFVWGESPPPLPSTILLLGLPRPQTARDILRDATTLGATTLHFVLTEKGEPSYAHSSLWTSGEWQRHCLAGAEQAFDTRVPTVTHTLTLAEALRTLPAGGRRCALDNYESTAPLARLTLAATDPVILALGPERGWSPGDRTQLREHGFALVDLGPRVLRCETAVVAALTLVQAARARA